MSAELRSLTICLKETQSLPSDSISGEASSAPKHSAVKKSFQPVAKLSWTKRGFWSTWGKTQGFWAEAESDRGRTGCRLMLLLLPNFHWSEYQFQAAVYWDCCICAEANASLHRGSSVSPGCQEPSHITAKGRLVPRKGSPDATSCTVLATPCALWQSTIERKREEIPLNVGHQAFRNKGWWPHNPVIFLFLKLISNADF